MFCFGISGVIMEKNRKSEKTRKSGHYRAPMSQRREPTPQHRPTPRHGIPLPREAKVPKWHPLGTPRRSYCSQRANFLDFCFRTLRICTPIV